MIDQFIQELYFLIFNKIKINNLLNLRLVSKNLKFMVNNYLYYKNIKKFSIFPENFTSMYKNIYDYENNEFNKFINKEKSEYNIFVIKNQIKNMQIDNDIFYRIITTIKVTFVKIQRTNTRLRCIDITYLNSKKKIIDFIIKTKDIDIYRDGYYNLAELSAIYGDFVQLKYFLKNKKIILDPNFFREWKTIFKSLNSCELVYNKDDSSLIRNYTIIENILLNYFLE